MKLKIALAAATMLVAPAFMTANAQQSGVYVSGGYTHFDGDGGAELGGVTGRVGVNLIRPQTFRTANMLPSVVIAVIYIQLDSCRVAYGASWVNEEVHVVVAVVGHDSINDRHFA